jgi:hypothetical protein
MMTNDSKDQGREALSDEQLAALKAAAIIATPQDIDGAERIEHFTDGSRHLECPVCCGEGTVNLEGDFCNYDGHALGVQFYGIGPEHGAAEAYFRAVKPSTVLALIERLERAESALATSASALARDEASVALTGDARNLVTLDRRDLWDHMRGAIHAALHDKIPKECVVSWAWEEATNRTMDIFQKIVDTAPASAATLTATVSDAASVPEGFALIPLKPDDAMQLAGAQAIRMETTALNKIWTANAVFRAMVNAASSATAPLTSDSDGEVKS